MRLLISGHEVLIDKEDYPVISRFNWYVKKGGRYTDLPYVCCEVTHNKKRIKLNMHRLIMGMGPLEVDHINRNPFDNRKINLRYCTPSQQQYNRNRKNKTGFKGVKQYGVQSYHAILTKGKKAFKCGPFKTAKEAAVAYDKMAVEYFGSFAALNFTGEYK